MKGPLPSRDCCASPVRCDHTGGTHFLPAFFGPRPVTVAHVRTSRTRREATRPASDPPGPPGPSRPVTRPPIPLRASRPEHLSFTPAAPSPASCLCPSWFLSERPSSRRLRTRMEGRALARLKWHRVPSAPCASPQTGQTPQQMPPRLPEQPFANTVSSSVTSRHLSRRHLLLVFPGERWVLEGRDPGLAPSLRPQSLVPSRPTLSVCGLTPGFRQLEHASSSSGLTGPRLSTAHSR